MTGARAGLPLFLGRTGDAYEREADANADQVGAASGSLDLRGARLHTDAPAARSALALGAQAYTTGEDVFFAPGQYQPSTPSGTRLLAHELTHVQQQRSGAGPALQCQTAGGAPATTNAAPPRVGIIPIAEFIGHVRTIEGYYPDRTPQEILTMIRSLYYGSPAGSPGFDRLIPDAPGTGTADQPVETCTDSEGSVCSAPVGDCTCVLTPRSGPAAAQNPAQSQPVQDALRRLREHADENAVGDNPSPYIQVGNDLVDVGHVLVGMDAVIHPRTAFPFDENGMPTAAGPSTWVGDLGAAMVWLKEHRDTGAKPLDVKGSPQATVEDYYKNSLPMTDLLGDVDAYSLGSTMANQQSLTLSEALTRYYLGSSGNRPAVESQRWRHFARANGLTFNQAGAGVTFTAEARNTVILAISIFANTFSRRFNPIRVFFFLSDFQVWADAPAFGNRFLADVKNGLERELAAEHQGQAGQ